jgi:nucleosome binding factor SPN SPT16 subunit
MTEWEESYKLVKADLEETDVSPGIAMAMSVKDEDEKVPPVGILLTKKSIQSASKTSLFLLTKFFEEEMGEIIETERKVSHIKLAEKVEAKLDDQKFLKSQRLGPDVESHSNKLTIV